MIKKTKIYLLDFATFFILVFFTNIYEISLISIYTKEISVEFTILSSFCRIGNNTDVFSIIFMVLYFFFFLIIMMMFFKPKKTLIKRISINISFLVLISIFICLFVNENSSFLGVLYPFTILHALGIVFFKTKLIFPSILAIPFFIFLIKTKIKKEEVLRFSLIMLSIVAYYLLAEFSRILI